MGSDEILTVGTEYPVGAPKVQLRSRANGQTLDSWTGGGGIEGTAWSCVIDPSGAFIIGGHLNPGGYEWFITKFNHDLEVVWTQGGWSGGTSKLYAMAVDDDGYVYGLIDGASPYSLVKFAP